MDLKRAVFALVIASLVLTDQAQAQTYSKELRGINQIGFTSEAPDQDAKDCQITELLIRDAFMYPASGARFAVGELGTVPYIYFNTITLLSKQDQFCVSHIAMRLQVHQQTKLEASGRNIFATISLWSMGANEEFGQKSPRAEHS